MSDQDNPGKKADLNPKESCSKCKHDSVSAAKLERDPINCPVYLEELVEGRLIDIRNIVNHVPDLDENTSIIRTVREMNDFMENFIREKGLERVRIKASVRVLLNKLCWNGQQFKQSHKEKFLHKFDDGKNRFEFSLSKSDSKSPIKFECEGCEKRFEVDVGKEVLEFGCGHKYCDDCWEVHIDKVVQEAGTTLDFVPCVSKDCDIRLDDEIVLSKIERNFELSFQYRKLMVYKYVECMPDLRFCKVTSCYNVIKTEELEGNEDAAPSCGCDRLIVLKELAIVECIKHRPPCSCVRNRSESVPCADDDCTMACCTGIFNYWQPYHELHLVNVTSFTTQFVEMATSCGLGDQKFKTFSVRMGYYLKSMRLERSLLKSEWLRADVNDEYVTKWWKLTVKNAIEMLIRCRLTLAYSIVLYFHLMEDDCDGVFAEFESNLDKLSVAIEMLAKCVNNNSLMKLITDPKQYDEVQYCNHRCREDRRALLSHLSRRVSIKEFQFRDYSL